jgi:hypothetical protein
MRFECLFTHPDRRDEEITIDVTLTAAEVKAVRALYREGDPAAECKSQAYALRHAYQLAPSGYQHIRDGVRQVLMN